VNLSGDWLQARGLLFTAGCWLAASMIAVVLAGCTIGPQVRETYVLLKPGVPVRILENRSLRTRTLAAEKVEDVANVRGGGVVSQDVGGWVAMPPEHWDMIERRLRSLGIEPKRPVE